MKYFTASGDDGTTGLLGESRVPKYHPRIEAIGSLDEANAALGFSRSQETDEDTRARLKEAQRSIYFILAEAAAESGQAARFRLLENSHVAGLEEWVEQLGKQVELPRDFIMPGDTPLAAAYDLARTAVRRAERRVVELSAANEFENPEALRFLNRLSTLCFMLELRAIQSGGFSQPTLAKTA